MSPATTADSDTPSQKKVKPFVLRAFVLNALRRASYRYPARNAALKKAKLAYGIYQCAKCLQPTRKKFVQVDHIAPVIEPSVGFQNYDIYIERLFCPEEGFQILCKECHKTKTKTENQIRRNRSS